MTDGLSDQDGVAGGLRVVVPLGELAPVDGDHIVVPGFEVL